MGNTIWCFIAPSPLMEISFLVEYSCVGITILDRKNCNLHDSLLYYTYTTKSSNKVRWDQNTLTLFKRNNSILEKGGSSTKLRMAHLQSEAGGMPLVSTSFGAYGHQCLGNNKPFVFTRWAAPSKYKARHSRRHLEQSYPCLLPATKEVTGFSKTIIYQLIFSTFSALLTQQKLKIRF